MLYIEILPLKLFYLNEWLTSLCLLILGSSLLLKGSRIDPILLVTACWFGIFNRSTRWRRLSPRWRDIFYHLSFYHMRRPYVPIIFDPALPIVHGNTFKSVTLIHLFSQLYLSKLVDSDILGSWRVVVHGQWIARNWTCFVPRKLLGPRKVIYSCSSIRGANSSFLLQFVLNIIGFCALMSCCRCSSLSATLRNSSKILTVSRNHF